MGTITRSLSNNITTGGVILPAGITNASVADVTSFANATSAGTLVLLSTQTASASATISFTTGLDSTYDAYEIKVINARPATDDTFLQFNLSTDSGANYNVTKTTTLFTAYHNEAGTDNVFAYNATNDLAQSTAFQSIGNSTGLGSGADENQCIVLQLFNPSSTTYVKHFIVTSQYYSADNYSVNSYVGGYANTTSAVNAIQFKMASGNIADGVFKLYGVKKS
jgi:hypothetical protein